MFPHCVIGGLTLAALVVAVGCERTPSSAPKSATVAARSGLDANAVLKHKVECRALGVQADKDQFPEGMNSVKSLNDGFLYFESEFGYSERLNTCIVLRGFQLVNLKTKSLTAFQATLTDLLTNKELGGYFVLGGQLSPASMGREEFIAKVRELLGDPVPRWLTQGPIR
jgi:hypothetical protein